MREFGSSSGAEPQRDRHMTTTKLPVTSETRQSPMRENTDMNVLILSADIEYLYSTVKNSKTGQYIRVLSNRNRIVIKHWNSFHVLFRI